jgi:membrane protein
MRLLDLLHDAWRQWRHGRAQMHSAGLAFYALFSLAPLALVATAVAAALLGTESAEALLDRQLVRLLTPDVAEAARSLIRDTSRSGARWAAGGIGLLTSVYAGSRGFLHLQQVLNDMWGVRPGPALSPLGFLRRRLLAFASVGLCGLLLLGSLLLSVALHSLMEWLTQRVHPSVLLARGVEDLTSLTLVVTLLWAVYVTLPDARVRWDDALAGASLAGVLFLAGKQAVSLYLRTFGATSAFGAAGSLVAFLIYVRYAAQVLLYGAEFTFVFARWRGRPVVPANGAALSRPLEPEGPASG